MSNWLTTLTQASAAQLKNMGDALTNARDRYIFWNDDYFQKAQHLVDQQEYKGKGATAFLEAVNTDINTSRPVYDGLGHVGSACSNLGFVMTTSSSTYDNRMLAEMPPHNMQWQIPQSVFDSWRDNLIQMTLNNIGNSANVSYVGLSVSDTGILNNVLQSGSASLSSAYNQAYQTVEAQAMQDAATYMPLTPGDPNLTSLYSPNLTHNGLGPDLQSSNSPYSPITPVPSEMQFQAYYLQAFNQLADEVKRDLTSWANELEQEYHNFQYAVHNSENYLSSRDVFDYVQTNVDTTQGTSKPITITPYKTTGGKNGLLISIGGTDPQDINYDTDFFTALQTGQGSTNVYLEDVKQALRSYMQEHPAMTGSEITLAGYSLGGMTAQQLANDIASGVRARTGGLEAYQLHVAQVITYGAPVMGAPLKNVKYNMYDATYDPIPLLSSYEDPLLTQLDSPFNSNPDSPPPFLFPAILAANVYKISTTHMMPWDTKLHSYIDPKGEYNTVMAKIHNINDVGNTPLGLGPKSTPLIENHFHYQDSGQLNAASTATTNIDVASLGPTEYFGMKNTENFYNKSVVPLKSTLSKLRTVGMYFPIP